MTVDQSWSERVLVNDSDCIQWLELKSANESCFVPVQVLSLWHPKQTEYTIQYASMDPVYSPFRFTGFIRLIMLLAHPSVMCGRILAFVWGLCTLITPLAIAASLAQSIAIPASILWVMVFWISASHSPPTLSGWPVLPRASDVTSLGI